MTTDWEALGLSTHFERNLFGAWVELPDPIE